jgi:putative ABC transport system substrate-binding protein
MRLVGILLPIGKDDPDYRPWISAFRQGLQGLGWIEGRNVRFDIRWATNNPGEIRTQAAELAALAPDVILAPGTSTVGPLMQATRTVPIVFPIIADPVAGGFVDSLARPGRNATGFMLFEYSISGKWLELLKQIAPGVSRVVLYRSAECPLLALSGHPRDRGIPSGSWRCRLCRGEKRCDRIPLGIWSI